MKTQDKDKTQKSKADILIERIDKIFIKKGLGKSVTVTKTGGGVYFPSQKRLQQLREVHANQATTTNRQVSDCSINEQEDSELDDEIGFYIHQHRPPYLMSSNSEKKAPKEKEQPKDENKLDNKEKPKEKVLTLEERMEIMSYPPHWQPSLLIAAKRGVPPKEMYEKSKGLEAFM